MTEEGERREVSEREEERTATEEDSRSSGRWRVGEKNIAWSEFRAVKLELILDGEGHRSKVNGLGGKKERRQR